jgi:hypothetical protein
MGTDDDAIAAREELNEIKAKMAAYEVRDEKRREKRQGTSQDDSETASAQQQSLPAAAEKCASTRSGEPETPTVQGEPLGGGRTLTPPLVTQSEIEPEMFGSKEDALDDLAMYYRRDLWRSQPVRVEVWCESDRIGGVIMPLTDDYGVAMLPCRGQPSNTFIWESAQSYRRTAKPVACLYVGDFDPAGLDLGNSLQERLERYGAPGVEFTRIAVEPAQVAELGLLGHGLNISASQRERFTDQCDSYGRRNSSNARLAPCDSMFV